MRALIIAMCLSPLLSAVAQPIPTTATPVDRDQRASKERELVTRAIDSINRADAQSLKALLAPHHVWRGESTTAQTYKGREGIIQALRPLQSALEGLRFTPTHSIATGDGIVAVEGVLSGRHVGQLGKVPPTKRVVRVPALYVAFIRDDEIRSTAAFFAPQRTERLLASRNAKAAQLVPSPTSPARTTAPSSARLDVDRLKKAREANALALRARLAAAVGDERFAPVSATSIRRADVDEKGGAWAEVTGAFRGFKVREERVAVAGTYVVSLLEVRGKMTSDFKAARAGTEVSFHAATIVNADDAATPVNVYVDDGAILAQLSR